MIVRIFTYFAFLFYFWFFFNYVRNVKVKAICGSYSTAALRHIVLLPDWVPFIHLQRRCTHQAAWETSASEGRNYTWNLASNL